MAKCRQPVLTAVQCQTWIVNAHFGLQRGDLPRRYVRRITHNQIEVLRRQSLGKITMHKPDSVFKLMKPNIALGHSKGGGGSIHRTNLRHGNVLGDGNGDAAAAGADIQNARSGQLLRKSPRAFSQCFRLWTGDEHSMIHMDFQSTETRAPQQVLQRHPTETLSEQCAQAKFNWQQNFLGGFEMPMRALLPEHMREHQLRFTSRRFNPAFLNACCCLRQQLDNRHRISLRISVGIET